MAAHGFRMIRHQKYVVMGAAKQVVRCESVLTRTRLFKRGAPTTRSLGFSEIFGRSTDTHAS